MSNFKKILSKRLINKNFIRKYTVQILFVVISFFFLSSCDELPSEVISLPSVDYEINNVDAPQTFQISDDNLSFISSIEIRNSNVVNAVWFNLLTDDGAEVILSNIQMLDNGNTSQNGDKLADDGIFSGIAELGNSLKSGKYVLEYYVKDKIRSSPANVNLVAVRALDLEGVVLNSPPVLNNLVMPDSVDKNVQFSFSVNVTDSNGLNDINEVFYELFDPDGNQISNSSGVKKFPMFDDGDENANGDKVAGDGVYTVLLRFPSNQKSGFWEFRFKATDKSNVESNTIIHKLYLR